MSPFAGILRGTIEGHREPLPRVLIWLLFTVRYIDDLFLPVFGDVAQVMGHGRFYDRREDGGADGIYPTVLNGPRGEIDMPLALNLASSGDEVHFLDVTVMFDPASRALSFKLYDKRRGNPLFAGVMNFPDMDSALSDRAKYSVLRSQMFRYDRNCSFAADFISNTATLAVQMIRQHYNKRRVLHEIEKYDNWDKSKGRWRFVKWRTIRRIQQCTQHA